MNMDIDDLLPFLKNDNPDYDTDLMEQMISYDRQAKWGFPVGLPECINLKALAETVIANSGLYSERKKDKWFGKLIKNPKLATHWYESLPMPQKQGADLTIKQRLVLSSLMMKDDRMNHIKRQLSKKSLKGIPEIHLINRYHKKLHGRPLFSGFDELANADQDPYQEELGQHPMEMLAFVRCESLHNVSSILLMRVLLTDILRVAYEDVFSNNERSADAASAIFAVGSLAECRWFLDFVYQKSPEDFARHYNSLSFFNPERLLSKRAANGNRPTVEDANMPYEAISLDLASDQFNRLMALHSEGLRLPMLEMQISDLAENMSFDIDEPLAVFGCLDDLLERTAGCESHLRLVRREIQDLVIHRLPVYMNDNIDRLSRVIDQFFSVFDVFEKPDMNELRLAVSDFCNELPNAKSSKVAGLLAGVMKVDQIVDSAEFNVTEILSVHHGVTDEIQKLSKDPAKNREKLQQALTELSEIEDSVGDSLENINDSISALRKSLEKAQMIIIEAQAREVKISKISTEDEAREHQDYEDLLEISEQENRKLSSEIIDLRAQKDHLTIAFSANKNAESTEGMTDVVREIILKRYEKKERLSVEECLTLTKSLFPNTVILPSAWSSASESTHYEYTEKLCDCLITLAGDYVTKVTEGQPDAEARKLFPNKVFAANESQTTSSGPLRKDREFFYNGHNHFFEKHLRLGVASDVRKTIRVHFDVIDSRLVIAFCGEHKRL